jgi:hypothetical protein
MASPTRKQETDFDPNDFLAAQGEHEKNISALTERISKIEGHLSTPQSLAAFLNESAKDSRVLEGVFAKMFCRFMADDKDVQDAVRKKIVEADRNFFYKNLKRLWLPIYSATLVVGTIVAKEVVQWLLSLIPHR